MHIKTELSTAEMGKTGKTGAEQGQRGGTYEEQTTRLLLPLSLAIAVVDVRCHG
jgi:hypothetical protein